MRIENIAGADILTHLIGFWETAASGVLSGSESVKNLTDYIIRNSGFSFVAYEGSKVMGTILCGHDGKRGYLHHIAVDPSYVGTGLVTQLVNHALGVLGSEGVKRCHIFVHDLAGSPILDEVLGATQWNEEQKEVYYHDIELPLGN